MSEIGGDKVEHFRCQRRNMMIISLVLIFYHAGNLSFEKANIFGNEVSIGEPGIVSFCLVSFFIYFLWRYYTACRGVFGVKSFLRSGASWFEQHVSEEIKRVMRKKNIRFHGEPYVSSSNLFEVLVSFEPEPSYIRDVHGKDFNAKLVEDTVLSYGIKFLPLRLYSAIYSIFNHKDFSEYIVPYVLAFLGILELVGYGPIEKFIIFFSNLNL